MANDDAVTNDSKPDEAKKVDTEIDSTNDLDSATVLVSEDTPKEINGIKEDDKSSENANEPEITVDSSEKKEENLLERLLN